MTAESKRVGQSYIHFTLLSLVERKVQVIAVSYTHLTLPTN